MRRILLTVVLCTPPLALAEQDYVEMAGVKVIPESEIREGSPSLAFTEQDYVEIAGVKVMRGMLESEIREAFPYVSCVEVHGSKPSADYCAVGDGESPEADGEVTFQEGKVYQASRNWFLPKDSNPYTALEFLNKLIERLTNEDATCAKIETHTDTSSRTTVLVLPKKTLSLRTDEIRGGDVIIRESLRVNPVPSGYRVHGEKMRGADWCAFVGDDSAS